MDHHRLRPVVIINSNPFEASYPYKFIPDQHSYGLVMPDGIGGNGSTVQKALGALNGDRGKEVSEEGPPISQESRMLGPERLVERLVFHI